MLGYQRRTLIMTSDLYHTGIVSKAINSTESANTLYLRPLNYYTNNNKAGQCLGSVFVSFSLQNLGFHLRLFHVGSMVDKSVSGTRFSPSTSVVPCQLHYANALYSFIQLSPVLHILCKRQHHYMTRLRNHHFSDGKPMAECHKVASKTALYTIF